MVFLWHRAENKESYTKILISGYLPYDCCSWLFEAFTCSAIEVFLGADRQRTNYRPFVDNISLLPSAFSLSNV